MASGSSMPHRPRYGPPCSIKVLTSVGLDVTDYCAKPAKPGNAAAKPASQPARVKPELVATARNPVWSWEITKLHGPAKWPYYHLYVILDIFSQYVVDWMVAHRESAGLGVGLFSVRCHRQLTPEKAGLPTHFRCVSYRPMLTRIPMLRHGKSVHRGEA